MVDMHRAIALIRQARNVLIEISDHPAFAGDQSDMFNEHGNGYETLEALITFLSDAGVDIHV